MASKERKTFRIRTLAVSLVSLALGLAIGTLGIEGLAQMDPPTKHRGVSVAGLGVVSEASMQKTIGLDGYILQMREITLEPGGAIAKHSHAERPGLVWTLSGSWIEGRASGERAYPAGENVAIVEDELTEHWFFNTEAEPVKAVVCDLVPPPS